MWQQSRVLHFAAVFAAAMAQAAAQTQPAQTAVNLAIGRNGACLAALADGRVLVVGGRTAAGAVANVDVLAAKGAATPVKAMQDALSGHSCSVLSGGRLLVAGGSTDSGATSAAEIYDPSTDSWSHTFGLTAARTGHTATTLRDGRVLIAGGLVSGQPADSLEVYSPTDGTFTAVTARMSSARQGHAATVLRDGRVLIAGGSDGTNALSTVDVFDPSTNTISAGVPLPAARAGHSATTLLDGKVLFAGGNDGTKDLSTAVVFDPKAQTYGQPVTMAAARSGHMAIALPNNNTVLIVGGTSAGKRVDAAESYVPWQGRFQPAQVKTKRAAAAVAARLIGASGGSGMSALDQTSYPTLTSDRTDYQPGETVTLTGTGWAPDEVVTIVLTVDPANHGPVTLTSTSDDNGNFTNTDYVVQQSDLGVTFYVTATGATGDTAALLTFTDAITWTCPTSSGTVGVSYSSNISFSGYSNSFCSLSVASGSSLPAGLSLGSASSGSAPISGTPTAAGSSSTTFTGVYGLACGFIQSTTTSPACSFTIAKGTSTTTVTASANPISLGASVSFTATVPSSATGTVQFQIDSVNFGSAVAVSSGHATSGSTTTLTAGSIPSAQPTAATVTGTAARDR